MARRSRRKNDIPCPVTVLQKETIYQTALYVRLSVLDGGKGDDGTVKTQELFLRNYVRDKPSLVLYSVYVDNGVSGMDFRRPEFERLMGDVKAGRVNCIVVKDLSRFGRNYMEAGEYLENLFPLLGIRFISVNDGYDSEDFPMADFFLLHLKNLINHVYVRDISAKVSPVLWAKQEQGKFIGTWAPYGYKKSPENHYKLIIDEQTAPVVRRLFFWKGENISYRDMVRKLTQEGILSPGAYRYQEGIVKDERFACGNWQPETIRRIVRNPVYLGHMVQGKKKNSLFQRQIQRQKQMDFGVTEGVIVKNTHEAIVDWNTFQRAQK